MSDFLGLGNEEETKSAIGGSDGGGLVFDLSGVEEDKGFEIMPKGDYEAIVDELTFGDSSSGNPMITVKYKIVAGEFEGRVVYDYWVLNGKGSEFGLAKLKKFLVRVTPEVEIGEFKPADFAEDEVAVGRELVLSLGIQKQTKGDYKGESRNTVRDIAAPSGNAMY
jgi:hypothetical protein